MKKLAIFGIDCLGMDLIDRIPESFEFIRRLQEQNQLQEIRSCDPPITIPAWSVMTTGKDPGELGVYGFSQRKSWNYFDDQLPSSKDIKALRIWDKLAKKGLSSCILSIPQTYPVKKINGTILSSILTPSDAKDKFYPSDFELSSDHIFDIDSYRSSDKTVIFEQAQKMLDQKNDLILRGLNTDKDFFFSVIIGSDRLNHAFYQYLAKEHKNYSKNDQYLALFQSYYKKLDSYLKEWFSQSKKLGYQPILISDHGVRPLKGLFPLNDWLIQKDYLVLKHPAIGEITEDQINWARSRVYAKGGYCGRLFVNKKYREPLGIVEDPQEIYQSLLEDFSKEKELSFKLLKTEDLYKRKAGYAPDFLLYVNDLDYRCSSKVYGDYKLRRENDTGPDGANHDFFGVIASELENLPLKIQDLYSYIVDFYTKSSLVN